MGFISKESVKGIATVNPEEYICPACIKDDELNAAIEAMGEENPYISFIEEGFIEDHYIACDRCGKRIT